ncbi:MAG: hypothetical protein EBY39_12270 [Flavobacteriia bacterium]|nr:hypothetical protein [Flavobacteriia bacterium]
MSSSQEKYIEERKKGMYNPIVGGVPMVSPELGDSTENQKLKQEVGRPVGTSDIPQESRSANQELFSRKDLQQIIYATEDLRNEGYKQMRKKLKKNKLKKTESEMIDELCQSVILSSEQKEWDQKLQECIQNPEKIEDLDVFNKIQELSVEHNLDLYSSAILFHSNRRS